MFLTTDNTMSVQYHMKRFTDSCNKDFIKALSIYSSNMAPALKTKTNEISYWLDNVHSLKNDRQFYVLGLYKNNEVIGYTQFMYFQNKRVVVIDYIVIEESERTGGSFFQFCDFIRNYIETNIEFDYILTEIGYLTNSKIPSDDSRALIKLVRTVGFGVIEADYCQPQLSPENSESQMAARLMVYMKPSMEQVKLDTYLSWIQTIFFDHYVEWYKEFKNPDELEAYKNEIMLLFNRLKKRASSPINITLSNSKPFIRNTPIGNKSRKMPSSVKFLGLLVCLMLFVLYFVAIWIYTKIDIALLLVIHMILLFLMLIIYSIFNTKARTPVHNLAEFIKVFFDKSK